MKAVYKYVLDPRSEEVEMPIGAELLSAGFQGDHLCIWAKVDTENVVMPRKFKVLGTGHEIPVELEEYLTFLFTCHMNGGLVFHLFEINNA